MAFSFFRALNWSRRRLFYRLVVVLFHGMLLFFHVTFIVVLWSCNAKNTFASATGLLFSLYNLYSFRMALFYFTPSSFAQSVQAAVNHAGNWLLLTLPWAGCPIKWHCPAFLYSPYFAPSLSSNQQTSANQLGSFVSDNQFICWFVENLPVIHCFIFMKDIVNPNDIERWGSPRSAKIVS